MVFPLSQLRMYSLVRPPPAISANPSIKRFSDVLGTLMPFRLKVIIRLEYYRSIFLSRKKCCGKD